MIRTGKYNQIDLSYRAGEFALRFEAEWDQSSAALFGPSGSGKSTLIEIIAGARRGAAGRIILEGRTILDTERGIDPPPPLRWIGWVPQDASLFPHMTAGENARYGLARGGDEGARRLAAAIEALEIGSLLERRAPDLSGGERQRVAVARAVGSGARILLLDEPLASLDAPLRGRIFPLFLRLRDELKLPILYVSHDPEEVFAIAEHVVVAQGGRCVASGKPLDVLSGALRAGVFSHLTAENRFEARLIEAQPAEGTALIELSTGLRLQMSATPPPERERFEVVVRAEEIILAQSLPGLVSAQNVLEGRVLSIREIEGHAFVTVSVGASALVSCITRRALAALDLREGCPVYLIFKAGAVRAVTRTD